MNIEQPKWSLRLDARRPINNPGFTDLVPILNQHFKVHEAAERFLGPYNAKQRNSQLAYMPPTKEAIQENVRQGGMNSLTYNAFVNALIRFCETTKGNRGLPTPHPSIIHSIQLALPAFAIEQENKNDIMINVIGSDIPLLVDANRLRNFKEFKFIIVRPRLSKLGTASANNWEILFFKQNLGYLVDWYDSDQNPRYSGIFN